MSRPLPQLLVSVAVAVLLLVCMSSVAVGMSGAVERTSGMAAGPTVPAEGTGGSVDGTTGLPAETTAPMLQQSDTDSSDESSPPPHRNPEQTRSEGDLDRLESVLRGSMDGALAASAARLDQGDYEQARQLLGKEYDEDLGRYQDLSGDTGTQQQADLFADARTEQQQYADAVEAYEETEQQYERAREAGDTDRARELAQELDERAEAVDRTGAELESTYETLGTETDSSYDDQMSAIETRGEDVEATQSRVTETELTETTLSVRTDQSTVAFQDSLTLSGELRTADGSAPDREEIQLRVANQTYTTALDSEGSFELTVSPSSVWPEIETLEIAYLPAGSSELRSSETTLPVSVASTATTVEITTASERAEYDTPVTATGVVTTENGEPVPETPVTVQIGGRQIASTETTADGEFSFDRPLPSDIDTGETELTISVPPSPLALDPSSETTPLVVESTTTTVSVDATTAASGEEILINGSVQSAAGRPVEETPVRIQVAGSEVGVVETDANGQFADRFVPPAGSADENVELTASVEPGGNLEPATDSTTVSVSTPLVGQRGVISPLRIGLFAFVGLIGLVGGVGWWLRQQPTSTDLTTGAAPSRAADSDQQRQLLAAAADRLDEGAEETAATLAYVAVRHQLRDRVDSSETATHWEWYQACIDAGVDRRAELETLTEAFEQVTFAPGEKGDAASHVVTVAQTVVDTNE